MRPVVRKDQVRRAIWWWEQFARRDRFVLCGERERETGNDEREAREAVARNAHDDTTLLR